MTGFHALAYEILNNLDNIDYIYQDISSYDFKGNPHLSLKKLIEIIPEKYRSKVICMHLDNAFNYEEVKKLGFKIAK